MKGTLDWQSPEIVNVFDESSLWAAPFGELLLAHIPMHPKSKVLDIGFGAGYPLIELSQRFGAEAQIYGIDIWAAAILRAKEKIQVLGLENITIFEQDATRIPLETESIDLICSNLGINNFAQKEVVLAEAYRVLKKGGKLCLSTNPEGTFQDLFAVFEKVLKESNHADLEVFQNYIHHRGTAESIIAEFTPIGFKLNKKVESACRMRFVNARAIFDHSLIRFGFLESWESFVAVEERAAFFAQVEKEIEAVIASEGEFVLAIPILYMEFEK